VTQWNGLRLNRFIDCLVEKIGDEDLEDEGDKRQGNGANKRPLPRSEEGNDTTPPLLLSVGVNSSRGPGVIRGNADRLKYRICSIALVGCPHE